MRSPLVDFKENELEELKALIHKVTAPNTKKEQHIAG